MTKGSTQLSESAAMSASGREDVAPRRKTIEFLRQFARVYCAAGLNDSKTELNGLVLN